MVIGAIQPYMFEQESDPE